MSHPCEFLDGLAYQAEEAAASVVAAEEREHCRQICADAKDGCGVPEGAHNAAF